MNTNLQAQAEQQAACLAIEMYNDAAAELDIVEAILESQMMIVLEKLDQELIGLNPVKTRIREVAALLPIERMRCNFEMMTRSPSLHMSFTDQP